jgi:TonB family protein
MCQQLPEGVYRAGNGVSRPEPIKHTDPEYSEEARIARLTGSFGLSFIVTPDGSVRDVRALAPPGLGLDEKAMEAVRSWQFKPGLKDRAPVSVEMNAEINFHLSVGIGDWALTRATFDLPEETGRPVLVAAPYPPAYMNKGLSGSATISFDVTRDGMTANLHVDQSSDAASEDGVAGIVKMWKFRPALQAGQPVPVRCTMQFVRSTTGR